MGDLLARTPWRNRHRAQPAHRSLPCEPTAVDASQAPAPPGRHTRTAPQTAHPCPASTPPAVDETRNHIRIALAGTFFSGVIGPLRRRRRVIKHPLPQSVVPFTDVERSSPTSLMSSGCSPAGAFRPNRVNALTCVQWRAAIRAATILRAVGRSEGHARVPCHSGAPSPPDQPNALRAHLAPGATWLQGLAPALNKRSIPTVAASCRWHHAQVRRLLARLPIKLGPVIDLARPSGLDPRDALSDAGAGLRA